MIYNFKDYINELWYKGLTRNKSDECRLENKNPIDKIIKILGEYIADKLNIKYSPNICELKKYNEYSTHYTSLTICIPVSKNKYLKHFFNFVIKNPYNLYNDGYNENEIYSFFISEIFTYLDTHDYSDMNEFLITEEKYEQIKQILFDFINEMVSKYKLNIKDLK